MSNKELKIIAVVLFLLFIYMLFIAAYLKRDYEAYDYHIEINESGETRIKTEEKDTVIQFNCLENYIKNDNI